VLQAAQVVHRLVVLAVQVIPQVHQQQQTPRQVAAVQEKAQARTTAATAAQELSM
jgi:hypothetical protein